MGKELTGYIVETVRVILDKNRSVIATKDAKGRKHMTTREALRRADLLRQNALPEEQKAAWLCELDGKVAEMMGADVPENVFPEDRELLMPAPYDNIYELYLVSMIDYYHQETELYANDRTIFNTAFVEAKAWWRRNNRPAPRGNWRTI